MGWCQNRSAKANLKGQDRLGYMDLKKYLTLCEKADTARRASAPPACQWDAEGRMTSVDSGSTATLKYNALGQRVERFLTNGSWTFDYLFGAAGEELGVYSAGTAAWFDQDVSMGRRILVDYGSPLRILHTNKLGTTTVTTDQTGAELQDELFYPWGQDWTRAGLPYVMHFAGMQNFENPGLVYPTDFRRYNPALGRWMSPDPMGGDVTNPQSFNRYAYVLNNPTTLTDPSGLAPPPALRARGYQQWRVACGKDPICMYMWRGGASCTTDGFETSCGQVLNYLEMGAAALCPDNFCSGFAPVGNGQIGFAQFAAHAGSGGSGYNLLTQPIPDPSLPINQINAAYQLGCQYATNPCGSNDPVSVRYVGSTYNVTLNGNPLDQAAAGEAGYQDPIGFFHNGDTSYYVGSGGLFGINEGHVVDASDLGGVEAHSDSFGPYNPLHWIFEALPSLFINPRGSATPVPYTCSVIGGCH